MIKRVNITDLTGLPHKEALFVIEYCKDFAPRRAAVAAGYAADTGYRLRERFDIVACIDFVIAQRLETSHIDAEWLLLEAVDNHLIARQSGNINASNTALNLVAKHVFVDAFAAEKVEVNSDKEIMERLMRGRKRLSDQDEPDDEEVSFF